MLSIMKEIYFVPKRNNSIRIMDIVNIHFLAIPLLLFVKAIPETYVKKTIPNKYNTDSLLNEQ